MSETTEPGSYFVANYPPFARWSAEAVPDVLAAFDRPATDAALGLYLHIPFCRKRCKFCYFRVYTDVAAADVERYSQALAREAALAAARPAVTGRPLRYVYFGGGTPSFLSVRQLERLVGGLHESFGWDDAEEVTFECEPGTLSEPKIKALKALGVTRLSLGVENFDDAILEANGRAHLSAEIGKAWDWITAAGFPNVNVDLIAGMVGETFESWQRTVEKTLALGPDSVTIYQMELPFNTVFVRAAKDGGGTVPVADWPTKRAWVDWAFDRFTERGYAISSGYTLVRDPGRVHFKYRDMLWEGSDLVALGVASFGHLSGVHYQNEPHWDPYLEAVEAGRLPIARGLALAPRELLIRELVLQLKRGRLDAARLHAKYGIDPLAEWRPQWESLRGAGHLERLEPDPVLTRQGLLQVDALLPAFFEDPAGVSP
ncbi:MAG: coproporphyrinogen-III oxidase family protein [Planctomycetota bacterium]|jgi:oxygen-independent coproporphyrinogen-3 oxidase|nr:coproporphyrinogen-III oxidase family protein [Planctomycetota bacterium]MDA1202133.1 coproporphyrinogen-III oxidase family protein [Planctomycetota bacterium]